MLPPTVADELSALGAVTPISCSSKLRGDGCVRLCTRCGTAVHDLRLRTVAEVRSGLALLERRGVDRLFVRPNGFIQANPCPRRRRRRALWLVPAVVMATLGLVAWIALHGKGKHQMHCGDAEEADFVRAYGPPPKSEAVSNEELSAAPRCENSYQSMRREPLPPPLKRISMCGSMPFDQY
jgi:hypothetical protein